MADAPLSTAPVPACEGSSSTKGANCRMMPGEFAFDRFKELLLSEGPQIPTDQLQDFGWQIPLITSCDPSPFCITKEILSFEPQEDDIYKIFFRDTSVSRWTDELSWYLWGSAFPSTAALCCCYCYCCVLLFAALFLPSVAVYAFCLLRAVCCLMLLSIVVCLLFLPLLLWCSL